MSERGRRGGEERGEGEGNDAGGAMRREEGEVTAEADVYNVAS